MWDTYTESAAATTHQDTNITLESSDLNNSQIEYVHNANDTHQLTPGGSPSLPKI